MVALAAIETATPAASTQCSTFLNYSAKTGGAKENRTPDLLYAIEALSQAKL